MSKGKGKDTLQPTPDDGSGIKWIRLESLRDYFAGQALPGVYQRLNGAAPGIIASRSYEIADAMMKERDE